MPSKDAVLKQVPDQIRVTSRDCVVTLDGFVRSEREKRLAELDAWYLFGVDKVVNNLNVLA